MKIFIIAGEPSGDLLGARLLAALKAKLGSELELCGIAGPRMMEQGMHSLFPMSDLTLFGLAELLPKIPLILRRMRETEAAIRAEKPDLVVTIDAPDFSFRIAKRLRGSGIKFMHYVAPTVWAWREKRAQKIQPLYQHLMALFPFEPPYFERVGLPCSFVGHPLVEAGIETAQPQRLRAKYDLPAGQPLLVLLPGSRRSELNYLLPVFEQVVARLQTSVPHLRIVLPTLPHWAEKMAALTASWAIKPLIVTSDADKYDAFAAADAALAASGTVALELGLAGTPAVIAYKLHQLTYKMYRRLIKVKYANLVNIMADDMAVPEFLQDNCTAEQITPALVELLTSEPARQKQRKILHMVRRWLSPEDGQTPSQKAADVVIRLARG